jgi:hypothetical protein
MADYVRMCKQLELKYKRADLVRLKGPEDAKQNERRSTIATAVIVQLWCSFGLQIMMAAAVLLGNKLRVVFTALRQPDIHFAACPLQYLA